MRPKTPILQYGPDYCRNCKTRSIEIFDYFNNPMGYSTIARAYMDGLPSKGLLDRRVIYRMRCRRCSTIYQIRWDNGYPVPDLYPDNKDYKKFLNEYESFNE